MKTFYDNELERVHNLNILINSDIPSLETLRKNYEVPGEDFFLPSTILSLESKLRLMITKNIKDTITLINALALCLNQHQADMHKRIEKRRIINPSA